MTDDKALPRCKQNGTLIGDGEHRDHVGRVGCGGRGNHQPCVRWGCDGGTAMCAAPP